MPQIRVRADTQSREGTSQADALARLSVKESSHRKEDNRPTSLDNTEGESSARAATWRNE